MRTTVAEMTGNILNGFFLEVDFAIDKLLQKSKCFLDYLRLSWPSIALKQQVARSPSIIWPACNDNPVQ